MSTLTNELSNRELDIYENIGLPNKEIAWNLGITEKTVKFHKTNIFKKLKVRSTRELLATTANKNTYLEPTPTKGNET